MDRNGELRQGGRKAESGLKEREKMASNPSRNTAPAIVDAPVPATLEQALDAGWLTTVLAPVSGERS